VVRVRDFLRGKLGARAASRPPAAKAACRMSESGGPVGICKTLQSDCKATAKRLHRALGDAPARRQRRPANCPEGADYRHAMAPACRPVLAEQSWRGTRDSAPPPAASMGLAIAMTYAHLKGPSPTKKGAIGLV
jgi:hypothetical protein